MHNSPIFLNLSHYFPSGISALKATYIFSVHSLRTFSLYYLLSIIITDHFTLFPSVWLRLVCISFIKTRSGLLRFNGVSDKGVLRKLYLYLIDFRFNRYNKLFQAFNFLEIVKENTLSTHIYIIFLYKYFFSD